MTELNHRRGTRGRRDFSSRHSFGGMPAGEAKEWQCIRHGEVRAEVRALITQGAFDAIPPDRPRTVRWDYW